MKLKIQVGDQVREIEVVRQGDRLRIMYGGETTEARIVHTEGAHFVLEYEQEAGGRVQRRRLRAAGHVEDDRRQLWVNGSLLEYERLREQGAAAGRSTAASLAASIPAVVSEILVAEGDHVSAGQKLILLESMKMVLPIQAPRDGLVAAIHCAPGDAVQPGVPLLEIREEKEG